MCKEQPSVEISNGSPSLLKTATDPRRVMHNTRRLSLVQAMSAIHQDLKVEMDFGIRISCLESLALLLGASALDTELGGLVLQVLSGVIALCSHAKHFHSHSASPLSTQENK